jgi:hypothetical protein
MGGGGGHASYGANAANKRKGQSNDPECRLDYVCEQLGISRTQVPNITEIDIVLDDLCRMDFVGYFINLRNIVLINQGISEVEGLDKL